ncbi:MAG TPA: aminotransferase class III-fold pyridoxal phosphate-dependent enzyme [Longimicrobiaceae bacterium]|nr:aminotransferase class III-fold pyridoxal phosphate-dependent enzyme [Longimicrobiaceae bacterium]
MPPAQTVTEDLSVQNGLSAPARHLGALASRISAQAPSSKHLAERIRAMVADHRTPAGFHPLTKEMAFPPAVDRCSGSRFWDVDGNEYVDFTMCFGAALFGHNPPFIQDAIRQQLGRGFPLGMESTATEEVAQLLRELTGHERMAFCNSGTEAVMTALRIARAATGRSTVALFSGSYHGHFDGTLAVADPQSGRTVPQVRGVLPAFVENVLVLEYGSPQALDTIARVGDTLAAVLVEPVQSRFLDNQPREFLLALREITARQGAVLIFDEMITGFRVAPGGAQEWFGVRADLAAYGKVAGGGMPIGIVAGDGSLLDRIDGGAWSYGDDSAPRVERTAFGGTFSRHPLAMVAARAALHEIKSRGPDLQRHLNERTARLVERLNEGFAEEELPVRVVHFGSMFGPSTSRDVGPLEEMDLIHHHLRSRGVLVRGGGGFLSTAHTGEDLDFLCEAVRSTIGELRDGGLLPPRSRRG